MRIRLIAIDIDGTLLDSRGDLPSDNRQAVRDALDADIDVALVTGRAFHHAKPVADALSERVVLIVSNGAITKRADGTTVASQLLPRATARAIVTETRALRGGAALIFDRLDASQYVFEGIDWTHPNRWWYYQRNRRFMTEVPSLEAALTEDPAQVAFTGGVQEMRALATAVRALPAATNATVTLTEYEARDFSLLDIIAADWSKGAALAAWARRHHLDPDDVMAVGDNLNDREMLEFAGRPIVMGNAVEELKTRGWPVTAIHDEGGLAVAIRTVVLGDAKLL